MTVKTKPETKVNSEWGEVVYSVKIRLLEKLLGTQSSVKSIFADHIATKQRKALAKSGMTTDEIEAELQETMDGLPEESEAQERGHTVFFRDDAGYFLRNYEIKGFLKSAATAKKNFGAKKQLKNKVGQFVHVRPVKMYIAEPGATLDVVERPLRTSGPMGERTAIVRSDSVPDGTEIEFTLHVLQDAFDADEIRTLLEYGEFIGIGQWRSSGCGRFEIVELNEV